MQPSPLDFICQVSSPDFGDSYIVSETTSKNFARNAPRNGRRLGTGVAVIEFGIDRCLRQHGSDIRTLEGQQPAVCLIPDKMDDAAADKVHEPYRITQMKNGRPCRETAFVSGEALEQR